MTKLIYIIIAIVIFGLLIAIHELVTSWWPKPLA